MRLIVQKFGGTSVKNKERIFNVANIVTNAYKSGNNVIAVVSAQGIQPMTCWKKQVRSTPMPVNANWICCCRPANRFPQLCLQWQLSRWDTRSFR